MAIGFSQHETLLHLRTMCIIKYDTLAAFRLYLMALKFSVKFFNGIYTIPYMRNVKRNAKDLKVNGNRTIPSGR